jgi:hypothetical protein
LTDVTREIVSAVTNNAQNTDAILDAKLPLTNHACYYPAVKAYNAKCFDLACNDYSLRQMYAIVNMCETGYKSQDIITAIDSVCGQRTKVCGIY